MKTLKNKRGVNYEKVLIMLTNVEKYKNYDLLTGLQLGELTHFYDEIKRQGLEVDFVSPKGGYVLLDPYQMCIRDSQYPLCIWRPRHYSWKYETINTDCFTCTDITGYL